MFPENSVKFPYQLFFMLPLEDCFCGTLHWNIPQTAFVETFPQKPCVKSCVENTVVLSLIFRIFALCFQANNINFSYCKFFSWSVLQNFPNAGVHLNQFIQFKFYNFFKPLDFTFKFLFWYYCSSDIAAWCSKKQQL